MVGVGVGLGLGLGLGWLGLGLDWLGLGLGRLGLRLSWLGLALGLHTLICQHFHLAMPHNLNTFHPSNMHISIKYGEISVNIYQFKHLLNLAFNQGIFPDTWKKAQITPLPKDGDLTICNNYRPTSLLPLPGKIADKIVHNRLMNHLETNNLLHKNQGGFRKNNSTIKFGIRVYT